MYPKMRELADNLVHHDTCWCLSRSSEAYIGIWGGMGQQENFLSLKIQNQKLKSAYFKLTRVFFFFFNNYS